MMLADCRLNVRMANSESRLKRESFSIESDIKARTSSSIALFSSLVEVVGSAGVFVIAKGSVDFDCSGSGVPRFNFSCK